MSKLKKRKIYERLWTGRDFEITHLWQRSVFLATFLVMIVTAYSGLWFACLSEGKEEQRDLHVKVEYSNPFVSGSERIDIENPEDVPTSFYKRIPKHFSYGFLALSLIGEVLSLLWIFMAKGSKYWYEKYESSIDLMHEDEELFSDKVNHQWFVEDMKAKLEWRRAEHVPIQGYLKGGAANQSIFSREGGPYSMSKVNIVLGQIFTLFWFLAFYFHITAIVHPKGSISFFCYFLSCAAGLCFLVFFLKRWTAGGEYERYQYAKDRWLIKDYFLKKGRDRKKDKNLRACYEKYSEKVAFKDNYADREQYIYKKNKLDARKKGHLTYLDELRMRLFLEEYVAPSYFPVSLKITLEDRKDEISIERLSGDDQDSILDIQLPPGCRYRCFADIRFIPEIYKDDDEINLTDTMKMQVLFLDNHGDLQRILELRHNHLMGYEPINEYTFYDNEGKTIHSGFFSNSN